MKSGRRLLPFSTQLSGVIGAMLLAACGGGAAARDPLPFRVTETARFNAPWAMAFLPDGRALVTEKAGELKLWQAQGPVGTAL